MFLISKAEEHAPVFDYKNLWITGSSNYNNYSWLCVAAIYKQLLLSCSVCGCVRLAHNFVVFELWPTKFCRLVALP